MLAGRRQSEVKRQEGICQQRTAAQSGLGGRHWSPLTNVNGEMATAVKGSFTCATCIYTQQVFRCMHATGTYLHVQQR